MQKIFWIYIIVITAGIIFLLLPETGYRLISVNEYHGPSFMDVIGLVLIITCWLLMLITSVKRYKKIMNTLNPKLIVLCIAGILTGSIWIVVSLLQNTKQGWIPGTAHAVAGYSVLFITAFKKEA